MSGLLWQEVLDLFLLESKFALSVADCPTQLKCIWIFVSSMTKLKGHSREICYPISEKAVLEQGPTAGDRDCPN